jgi:hypothetical protein
LNKKKELKYYCSLCDCVSFSSLYYESHKKSKPHKNNIIKEATNIITTKVNIPNQMNEIINSNDSKTDFGSQVIFSSELKNLLLDGII